jgi:hypothetical protein
VTRTKRILAASALAVGVLGGITAPALAAAPAHSVQDTHPTTVEHNHGTSVPKPDNNQGS